MDAGYSRGQRQTYKFTFTSTREFKGRDKLLTVSISREQIVE